MDAVRRLLGRPFFDARRTWIRRRDLVAGCTLKRVLLRAIFDGGDQTGKAAVVRRGREKLHFVNPVPLQQIYERTDLGRRVHEAGCSLRKLVAGSSWKMVHSDGRIPDAGEIVDAYPPRRMVIRWQHQDKPELKAEGASLCTMQLESIGPVVKLVITHTIEREPSKLIVAVSGGWRKVMHSPILAFTSRLREKHSRTQQWTRRAHSSPPDRIAVHSTDRDCTG